MKLPLLNRGLGRDTRIQAFLASGLERTGPGNQGGVTVTYTGTPGHNAGL